MHQWVIGLNREWQHDRLADLERIMMLLDGRRYLTTELMPPDIIQEPCQLNFEEPDYDIIFRHQWCLLLFRKLSKNYTIEKNSNEYKFPVQQPNPGFLQKGALMGAHELIEHNKLFYCQIKKIRIRFLQGHHSFMTSRFPTSPKPTQLAITTHFFITWRYPTWIDYAKFLRAYCGHTPKWPRIYEPMSLLI